MAARNVGFLNNVGEAGPSTRCAALVANRLSGVEGFDMPSWKAFADGLRSPLRDPEGKCARWDETWVATWQALHHRGIQSYNGK